MAAFLQIITTCIVYVTWSKIWVDGRPQSLQHEKKGFTSAHKNFEDISGNKVVVYDGDGTLTGDRDPEGFYYRSKAKTFSDQLNNTSGKSAINNFSPRKIIGHDDRIRIAKIGKSSVPFNAIVQLDRHCTGFFVGPRHILTAAHCIYSFERRQYFLKRYAYQAKECTDEHCNPNYPNCFKIEKYLLMDSYVRNGLREHDFAMVIVNKNTKAWLKLGTTESMIGESVSVMGYPGDTQDGCMYASYGKITSETEHLMYHDCDTERGMSGSPIYVYSPLWDNSKGAVYGIHRGSFGNSNIGVKITAELYLSFQDWIQKNQYD